MQSFVCNRLCEGMFQTCFECGRRGQVLQAHPLPISPFSKHPTFRGGSGKGSFGAQILYAGVIFVMCPVQSIELTPGLQSYMHCTAAWAQVATKQECLPRIVGPCRNNSSTLSSLVFVQEVWPLRLCGNDYWSATA